MRPVLALVLSLTACWNPDPAALNADAIPYSPAAGLEGDAALHRLELPLVCPDGLRARLYVALPEGSTGLVPTAVLYHGGALDYVRDADPVDPLFGDHLYSPSRLTRDWAVRQTASTLGIYEEQVPAEVHTGALAAALLDAGIAVVAPTNCWGDLWHNGDLSPNAEDDGFSRRGGDAALLTWGLVEGTETGVALPFSPDPAALYAIGLGEGGQAVAELVRAGSAPRAVILDSYGDDLSGWWDGTDLFAPLAGALDRIYPDRALRPYSSAANWPPTYYLFAEQDDLLPPNAHAAFLAAAAGQQDVTVDRRILAAHVLSGADPDLAASLVTWLKAQ